MGKDPDALSPLTSEFLVEAQSGGTCVVRVTSSGFGTGADWESEFWDDMGSSWMPFFDNLRLYLSHFPGQEATTLEVTASHPGDAEALWSTLHDALELGEEGATVDVRGATGTVERVGRRQALVRLTAPVPGILSVFAHGEGEDKATAGVRAYLFSADAADYVRREEPAWQTWLEGISVRAADPPGSRSWASSSPSAATCACRDRSSRVDPAAPFAAQHCTRMLGRAAGCHPGRRDPSA